MKRYLFVIVLLFVALKTLQLLNLDEIILDFFVLGIIPGTNFALNIYMVAILGLICLVYIWKWAKKVNEQLIAFKLDAVQKEATIKQTPATTNKRTSQSGPEVEIEELKIAST